MSSESNAWELNMEGSKGSLEGDKKGSPTPERVCTDHGITHEGNKQTEMSPQPSLENQPPWYNQPSTIKLYGWMEMSGPAWLHAVALGVIAFLGYQWINGIKYKTGQLKEDYAGYPRGTKVCTPA